MPHFTNDKYIKKLWKILVEKSNQVLNSLAENGAKFKLSVNRQVSSAAVTYFH
jgi:hypothetical protein